MERPATSASEKASPLLASSFVLLEGERRLSPFLPLSLSPSLVLSYPSFFCSLLPSLYFSMTSENLSCSFLSFPPLLFLSPLPPCIFLSPLHYSISSRLTPASLYFFQFLSHFFFFFNLQSLIFSLIPSLSRFFLSAPCTSSWARGPGFEEADKKLSEE